MKIRYILIIGGVAGLVSESFSGAIVMSIIAFIAVQAFQTGLWGGLINVYKKSIASNIVQNLLEQQRFFSRNHHEAAVEYIEVAWKDKPDIFNGKFGKRPHKLSTAIYTLALAASKMHSSSDEDAGWVLLALGNALSEIETNGDLYPFQNVDFALIKDSMSVYLSISNKHKDKYGALVDELMPDGTSPQIKDDHENGVVVMTDFPYKSFEDWDSVYRDAAAKANDTLEPLDDLDGKSLIDLMDDEAVKRAYRAKLDPKLLGKRFGETFDPLKMGFN